MELKKLSKRIMNIPIRYALIFTLLNMIFLFYFGHILIRIALFCICVIILYFFGRLPFADVDPVPFTSALNFLFFGLPAAIQYAIWVCPASDAITGNFNQWTFVTLFSIISSLYLSSLFGFSPYIFLIAMILIYNAIKFFITIYLGSLSGGIISTSTNAFIYVILTNLIMPLIELAMRLFVR